MAEISVTPATRTWAEISASAIRANAEVVKKYCPDSQLIAVLKADGYGHGARLAARALGDAAAQIAVANVTEARELCEGGITRPILILSPALPMERREIIESGWIPTVSSLDEFQSYAAGAEGRRVAINLKVDTGMGRAGLLHDSAEALLQLAQSTSSIQIAQISTHLASSDCDEAYTRQQLTHFAARVKEWRHRCPGTTFHALNSAGILRFGDAAFDSVRPGLMLYGVSPLPEFQSELTPACTWKTRICLVRDLPPNHGVSYGRRYITAKPTRTGLLAAGYADGYPRTLSGQSAEVLIQGQRCPVLGIITMDLLIVDLSHVPTAQVGDEVILMGRQGNESIGAAELAQKAGTIPWEILTGIQNRVRRVEVDPVP